MSVTDLLKEAGCDFKVYDHPPVFTVDQAKQHTSHLPGVHCKNLFLRNRKGKQHFLFVFQEDRQVNLKDLSDSLGTSGLSFASEERLYKYLKLKPGSVGPLGLIHDCKKHVTVYFDQQIVESEYSSFHPNINTQTIVIKTKDLLRFIESLGYTIHYI
ncbi:prolyl-tRNA synthetase associated domain-containing protein [Acidaminobacter sp. JC074]|uniref:prolyl-tRNA synthetase associated domain-containing protein n=1 Tax=Acidaminobacter sp. JC074 TaxID=2530199 RepID=UPI001F0D3320|nr:prolyl-tRNA synthetase associated domain-containing protein [Acidaminobacter sp. JC074]MCH4886010.1 prolyl-tRNA synthetase associated domain-containing protein [Acidaminobacter sp. JC074]